MIYSSPDRNQYIKKKDLLNFNTVNNNINLKNRFLY